jgi:hypothetical protein
MGNGQGMPRLQAIPVEPSFADAVDECAAKLRADAADPQWVRAVLTFTSSRPVRAKPLANVVARHLVRLAAHAGVPRSWLRRSTLHLRNETVAALFAVCELTTARHTATGGPYTAPLRVLLLAAQREATQLDNTPTDPDLGDLLHLAAVLLVTAARADAAQRVGMPALDGWTRPPLDQAHAERALALLFP